jgi:hypothetical protein
LRIHLRASGRVECKLPKECCCDNSLLRQFDVMQSILMMSSILATRTFFPMRYLSLPLGITRLRGIDFQKLEDKIFGKFTSKNWRNSTKAVVGCLFRRSSLLKLSNFLISLELANKVLNKINSLLRAYLFWAGCDKITGGKCMVNWETVCYEAFSPWYHVSCEMCLGFEA